MNPRPPLRSRSLLPLLSIPAIWLASPAAAQRSAYTDEQAVTGTWQATMQVGSFPMRLVLNLEPGPAGELDGTLVSLDQGGAEVPVEGDLRGDSVRVVMETIDASFAGRLTPDRRAIDGRWLQEALAVPLRFTRSDGVLAGVRRPQEPLRPLPYREEEVSFASADAEVRLSGTLTLPAGAGPYPAVVLVSGSGPHDRDGAMMGHRPFLVLADHLTRSGIAVLRVDDRGIGRSTGSFAAGTLEDFAADALAGARFLAARPEVDPARVGLVGHSEGAVVAPMAAARSRGGVAFVVMLAGTGVSGDSILRLQTDLMMRASGISPARSARLAAAQVRMFAAVRDGSGAQAARRLREAAAEFVGEFSEEERRAAGLTIAQVEGQVRSLMTPALRMLLEHDPAAVLRALRVPVLALNGGRDLQVPPRENLDAIDAALRVGGNPDYAVVELPGLNHLFQTAATGAPQEYALIDETFSPDAMRLVSGWILQRFGGAK